MLEEVHKGLDPARVHFTGIVPYETMIAAMSISAAHVYYTYPFVLSWSLLEAMACECLVLGSNTPPLWDAIEPGRNGILNDFFDPDALADTAPAAGRDRARFAPLREAARRTVIERYDRNTICLPAWLALVEETLAGRG
jgi:glycosyltransferase involved in cell wall biosynthesis